MNIKSKSIVVLFVFKYSNALLFKQDFESLAVLSDYISAVPDIGEFSGMRIGQSGLATFINNGRLQFERTGTKSMDTR